MRQTIDPSFTSTEERLVLASMHIYMPKIEMAAASSGALADMLADHLATLESGNAARFTDAEVNTIIDAIKCCNALAAVIASDLIDQSALVVK